MPKAKKREIVGHVALVGAGSGDPGLITVRGLELLTDCDALVYDNLMADEFVAISVAEEKIFVGKSSGRHAMPQEEINALLVRLAEQGKLVVRLKGGDSFVFGRGGEECQALMEAGIPFEVVPGVTAGIAGTAYAGVPVTHREMSRGVTMMTAHFAKDRQVELPYEQLAKLGHTLVFYMVVASIGQVCKKLIDHGMNPKTPAMVLERATTSSQRQVVATVKTIAKKAEEVGVRPPGILIIGDVVSLAGKLAWQPERPLSGKSVLFTRAVESEYRAIDHLRELGAEVLDVPVISAVPRTHDPQVKHVIEHLDDYACIAFTSALAVEILLEALRESGQDVRRLARQKLAAGSPTVVRKLAKMGLIADIRPAQAGQGQLVKEIARANLPKDAKVLLPRSSSADESMPMALKKAGLTPVVLSVYDSDPLNLNWLDVKLANWRPDAVVFLSSTCVSTIMEAAPGLGETDPKPIWACTGKKTAASLQNFGVTADVVPESPDVNAMIEDVIGRLMPK